MAQPRTGPRRKLVQVGRVPVSGTNPEARKLEKNFFQDNNEPNIQDPVQASLKTEGSGWVQLLHVRRTRIRTSFLCGSVCLFSSSPFIRKRIGTGRTEGRGGIGPKSTREVWESIWSTLDPEPPTTGGEQTERNLLPSSEGEEFYYEVRRQS